MWLTSYLLCLTAAVSIVQGRPEGAPIEACRTLHPGHAGQEQQYTPLPYKLIVDNLEPNIDDKLTLTIRGESEDDKIAGFLVQVREKCETPIGTFATSETVKTIDCPGGVQNTATHVTPNLKDEVVLTWTPPKGYVGPASFFVTVAKSQDVFWVARTTDTVWYMQPATGAATGAAEA